MTQYGVTRRGFVRKVFTDIWDSMKQTALSIFHGRVNVRPNSPQAIFWQISAYEDSEIYKELENIYHSWFPDTARGQSLSDIATGYLRLRRREARPAQGIVTFQAEAPATMDIVIPLGTEVISPGSVRFVTTEERVIRRGQSRVDVPVRSLFSGSSQNVTAGITFSLRTPIPKIARVHNTVERDTLTLLEGVTANATQSIPVNSGELYGEIIRVADIAHPDKIIGISLMVRNPASELKVFALQVRLRAYPNGVLLGATAVKYISLAAHEEQTITFENLAIPVSSASHIFLAVVNREDSQGPIEILGNMSSPYSGEWYSAGNVVGGFDAAITITSETLGAITGGQDQEDDLGYYGRFRLGIAAPAVATTHAIESELIDVNGVRSVKVIENVTLVNRVAEGGLPPKSVCAIVDGGETTEIARRLMRVVPVGIQTYGNEVIVLEDGHGHAREVAIARPERKHIKVKARVRLGQPLPAEFDSVLKDRIIAEIGGVLTTGRLVPGVQPGEPVRYARIIGAIMRGHEVQDVELTIGFDAATGKETLPMKQFEIAFCTPEDIIIERV